MNTRPPDWRSVRAILALECLDPVLPMLGVSRKSDTVRAVVREAYSPRIDTPLGDLELAADILWIAGKIDASEGEESGSRFRRWAESLFTGLHAEQPILSSWNEAFRAWAFDRTLPQQMRPPEPLYAVVCALAQADRAQRAKAKRAASDALATRLSDYDLAVLSAEYWLASEHPVIEIGFAAGMRHFMEGWQKWVQPLSVNDKELRQRLAIETLSWRGIDDVHAEPMRVATIPTCL